LGPERVGGLEGYAVIAAVEEFYLAGRIAFETEYQHRILRGNFNIILTVLHGAGDDLAVFCSDQDSFERTGALFLYCPADQLFGCESRYGAVLLRSLFIARVHELPDG
jgi:hypothetical protein